jgi:hypothetical protein
MEQATADAGGWAAQEVAGAGLGDPRRQRRASQILAALAAQPMASLPQACGTWAAAKGTYRFLANPAVAPATLRAAHQARTLERMAAEPRVLLVQDTTYVNFTRQPHIQGMGPLHTRAQPRQGLLVHTTLALSADGLPLGVLDQQVWARDPTAMGQAQQRKQRPLQAKESQKGLKGLAASTSPLPSAQRAVVVADREADVYDLFVAPRPAHVDLLIRAAHDRTVGGPDAEPPRLWAAAQALPEQARRRLAVPRADQQPERTATVSVRGGSLTLQPPRRRQRAGLSALSLQVVLVQEVAAPTGVTPVQWLLLTTLPVASATAAWQVVEWYRARWRIEQFHFVLKSGCRFERLQLDTAERLERALARYSIVAWRLLWLTLVARQTPEASAEPTLRRAEWQTLWCVHHQQPTPPAEPPTLREAVRWIAQLGGFLARKGDGEPGVQTLWHGWRRLTDLTTAFTLARQPPTSG